ncbi:MAG: phage regulatory protein/antirepressor Ant [Azoarcus sp.]|jgi:phage regulator Rha-like protein|nr:phage regulatory protein/antirepressor Ant [Azoarcus sp.]
MKTFDYATLNLDLNTPKSPKGNAMNELISIIDGQAVTTSLAIAEGTENEHASVIKLVRTYLADLEAFGRVVFQIAPFETPGGTQKREVAILNEQQSTLLLTLMRNSEIVVRFKVKLVKAFFETLKQFKDPMQVLSDPAAMRGLLLTYTEKVIALESKVQEQAPKVEALDRITASPEHVTITQAAKVVGEKRETVIRKMRESGLIYRQNDSWVAYDKAEKQGLLLYKEAHYTDEKTGQEIAKPYCHLTQKGLVYLAKLFGKSGDFDLFPA